MEKMENEKEIEISKGTIKYDISEENENSIIYNIYDEEINNYIIEDKNKKDNGKAKNTLIRFILTNNGLGEKYFRAQIKFNKKIKNEIQLNIICPKEIKDHIEGNNIKSFLNLQRLRNDLDFIRKDDITISLNLN